MLDEGYLRTIRHGIELFNAQKYWECHEELENAWIEDPTSSRHITWAIIQVAVALYHYQRGNLIGAKSMLRKAKEKLDKGNVRAGALLHWAHFKELVQEGDFMALLAFKFPVPQSWKRL